MRRALLTLALTLFSPLVMAQQPSAGGSMRVSVEHVSPVGVAVPLAGHPVILEAWTRKAMSSEMEISEAWRGSSDAAGLVVFSSLPSLPPGSHYRASVLYRGVSFATKQVTGPNPMQTETVRVYERTADASELTGSLVASVRVEEAVLVVNVRLFLDNPLLEVVDLDQVRPGLRMPLLLPAVFGAPLDRGLIPMDNAGKHMRRDAEPDRGRFVFADGALYYRGPILPGDMTLTAAYAVPIVETAQTLALSAPVELERVFVSGEWSDRIAPRLIVERPHSLHDSHSRERWGRAIQLDDGLKKGEPLLVQVDRLPVVGVVPRAVTVGGSVLLVTSFGLAVVIGRRRRRHRDADS